MAKPAGRGDADSDGRRLVYYNGMEVDMAEGKDVERPGFFRQVMLSWVTSLVRTGFRTPQLESHHLFRLRDKDEAEANELRLMEMLERYKLPDGSWKRFAIWRAAYRVYRSDFILGGMLEVSFQALRFTGPIFLRLIVLELEAGNANAPFAYGLGVLLFVTQFLSTLCQAHSLFYSMTIGLRLKNALSMAVFKQLLLLDQEGSQTLSDGKVLNLLTTDAQVAVEVMRLWNRLWTAPIVLLGGIAYIYVYIGPSVFFALLLMILFVPVTMYFGRVLTQMQRKKMVQTDTRIKLVNEMMQGIKVLKLNAWEGPLLEVLNRTRALEMKAIKKLHYYRGITVPFAIAVPNIASVIAFGAYILLGNAVTPADTFAVVSAFAIIRGPFVVLPMGMTMISRGLVSAKRFENFFSLSKLPPHKAPPVSLRAADHPVDTASSSTSTTLDPAALSFPALVQAADVDTGAGAGAAGTPQEPSLAAIANDDDVAIVADNASFSWSLNTQSDVGTDKAPFSLRDLSFSIRRGELVGIVGRIGDGKSSLISGMLGDMRAVAGAIVVKGAVALCTQEPFIMNRTVRENILFESAFEEERYNRTLRACALVSDLAILPASDLTEIGERGVNVSGGQKARISLARAVYSQPDVIFLDDPLSAVDAHVGKHIFKHCISNEPGSALRGTTRIFVTNQLNLIDHMDRVIVLENGQIVEQGKPSELLARRDSIVRAMQERYRLDDNADSKSGDDANNGSVGDKDVNLSVATEDPNKVDDRTVAARAASSALSHGPLIKQLGKNAESEAKQKGTLVKKEGRESGQISAKVIAAYWLAGALRSWLLVVLVLLAFVVTEATFLSIDTWLALYSQQEPGEGVSERIFLIIYFSITLGYFCILMSRAMVYAAFSVEACRQLYYRLQNNVFFLPMSFFWETPLGRVLNRLTKDTNDVDVLLPEQMQWLIMTVVRVVGIICIIGMTVPVFLIAVVPFLALYYGVREYYRRTAVSVQRIESVLRSPIYSHLSETLQGMTTLKAYRRTVPWLRVATTLIGLNHRAFFAMEVVQIWLSMRLEFLGALIVLATAISIVATDAAPGLAGLALTYSLNVVINLNMTVRMSTQVESKMNAVERIVEYTELENETVMDKGAEKAPECWPSSGHIVLDNVSLRYRADLEPAIRNVTLDIPAGAKVGIVGKTGGGKSTLMTALFRLAPISSGTVQIDGVDISQISVQELRLAITCIPQDPVLFTATMRENLDPFNRYTDAQIWQAVDEAHLRKTIEALPDGLNSQISQGGENLSVGQRQLTCIARAVLRRSKIIMLDEASASLDQETDSLIQQSIRSCFGGATLLVIAHRLNTIIDMDLALVMHGGEVAEFGPIPELLQKENGRFAGLVAAAKTST